VSLLYFAGGILSISLSVAFLFEEVKKINIGFVLVSLFLSWWSFGFYFWITATSNNEASFWMGVANFGFILMPVAFYNWIAFLLEKDRRYMIIAGYVVSIAFSIFSFTNFYYANLPLKESFKYLSGTGFIYGLYIIFIYLGFFILGIIDLAGEIIRKKGKQIKNIDKNILFLSILVLILGISNFPLWYGIKMVPLGGLIAIFINIFLLVYTIIKYDIINKRSFYSQSLVGLILSVNFIEILFLGSTMEIIYKSIMLIFLMLLSSLLIKSYKEDIAQKEDLLRLGKKLEASNKKLKELDNAKNEFISIAAHQLRTPPTVIKGYLNLAQEDPNNKLDVETKDSLSRALASNDRLIELVEDILNISRIESGKMQYDFKSEQSVKKILREAVENFKIKAKNRGLRLKLEFSDEKIPDITMDSNKIGEVISNLLDNAIKYTANGSVIVKCFQHNNNVRIEVADTGMGISKKDIGNLFKKFSRGSNAEQLSSGGIGLGVYVGRKIVEAHHGNIWVESLGKGKGSTFIMELPIKNDLE